LFTLAVLLAWQGASMVAPPVVFPGPVAVLRSLWEFASSVRGWRHLIASILHVCAAVALSFVIGGVLAFGAHYVRLLRFAIHNRLGPFLNSFSGIGWMLLALMWFGVSGVSVVFAISAVLIPFALVNIAAGLAALDEQMTEMGRSFTRNGWRLFANVTLPSLLPFIFATLRIMFGVAWKVTLTAELFAGDKGLGYVINLARQEYDTSMIFAAIILIIAFVYSSDRFVLAPLQSRFERQYA
jgi:NitT/TauT family transport system permease protein/sulfonate transport system permease protein